MRYSVNIEVEGFDKVEISDSILGTCKEDDVLVILDSETNNKLNEYYRTIRNIIMNGNKLVVVMIGTESKIRKQICMLMATYRVYDIYSVDLKSNIDAEYVEELFSREPTIEEIEMFIGSDIVAYSEIDSLLAELLSGIDSDDKDSIINLIYDNRDVIDNFIGVINYMKRIVDASTTGTDNRVAELKGRLNELEQCVDKVRSELSEANRKLDESDTEASALRKEAAQAKQRCMELENKINSSGPVISTYSTVNTATIKCKPKSIIYFKEISRINYINSFITKYAELLEVYKLKVKLIIYDNKGPYNAVYKPINIIGSTEYVNNREAVVNKFSKLVIVETNQAILEDILKADYDIVIIYDRLRQQEDLIIGNCVFKYYVINSMTDIHSISTLGNIDKSRIITREGVHPDCLAISEIKDYKTLSSSAKLTTYMQMRNTGSVRERLFDMISEKTNVNAIRSMK